MGIKERKDREKKERRREIILAASELFLEKGYTFTTIEDIADKVELSTGTIYQYFKNKEELFASVNILGNSIILNEVEKAIGDNTLSPEQKIIQIKEAMYTAYSNEFIIHKALAHILTEYNIPTISNDLRKQIKNVTHKILNIIADIIEEGAKQGEFEKGDYMAQAEILWANFIGVTILEEARLKLTPKKTSVKYILDSSFDIFLKGIRKKSS